MDKDYQPYMFETSDPYAMFHTVFKVVFYGSNVSDSVRKRGRYAGQTKNVWVKRSELITIPEAYDRGYIYKRGNK